MITDMAAVMELIGRRRRGVSDQLKMLPGDPIRFMISATLADLPASRGANPLGASESIGVC
jgi:hypothetical protein